MAAALRILHVADSHIGADLPRRATARRPRRGSDFVTSYQRVLARAREHAVDLVIHAGDVFDSPAPSDGALAAATQPLWDLATAGVPVVVIPGNHERSALPQVLLLSHPNIHVLRTPQTVELDCRGTRVAVSGFPCLRRADAARFADVLAATNWQKAAADVRIVVTHQAFDGARCGPANYRFRVTDDGEVVPRDAVPRAFDYIAAGHIHRHQVLNGDDNVPIVYCGSPDRIALAEIGEPKGCVLVEFAGGRAQPRFLEHPVRPMAVVPIDVTGDARPRLLMRVLDHIQRVERDAFVHVRLSGTATPAALRDLRLTQEIRHARPDLLVAVSSQAIEWRQPERIVQPRRPATASVFYALHPPARNVMAAETTDLRSLPDTCGTYAFYDAAGRLSYVGKALRVRTRIRSHLRTGGQNGHFADWAARARRVELRPAHSELEALLVEAELIRVHKPPFNRQMRLWTRYWYLCAAGAPYGQLTVCRDPVAGQTCFGPLRSKWLATTATDALSAALGLAHCPQSDDHGPPARAGEHGPPARTGEHGPPARRSLSDQPSTGPVTPSALPDLFTPSPLPGGTTGGFCGSSEDAAHHGRETANNPPPRATAHLCQRYYAGQCTGPCADRITPAEYADRLQARDALLESRSHPRIDALLQEIAALDPPPSTSAAGARNRPATPRESTLRTLEHLHNTAYVLRQAHTLLNALLILPGEGERRTAAVITPRGLYLRSFLPGDREMERVRAWHRARIRSLPRINGNWLPKSVTDALCTAWRHIQRHPDAYQVVTHGPGNTSRRPSIPHPARGATITP